MCDIISLNNHKRKGGKGIIMATKAKKKTVRKAVTKPATRKAASECSPRECIRENRELKMHITIITVLSVLVCVLVAALVLVTLRG